LRARSICSFINDGACARRFLIIAVNGGLEAVC
jgi:hypothetical protein